MQERISELKSEVAKSKVDLQVQAGNGIHVLKESRSHRAVPGPHFGSFSLSPFSLFTLIKRSSVLAAPPGQSQPIVSSPVAPSYEIPCDPLTKPWPLSLAEQQFMKMGSVSKRKKKKKKASLTAVIEIEGALGSSVNHSLPVESPPLTCNNCNKSSEIVDVSNII